MYLEQCVCVHICWNHFSHLIMAPSMLIADKAPRLDSHLPWAPKSEQDGKRIRQ